MPEQDRPVIALTAGDPNGIGPEVVLKALADSEILSRIEPVLIGSTKAWDYWVKRMGLDDLIESLETWEVDTSSSTGVEPGRLTAESGRLAMRSVSMAIEECLDGRLDGIVTAPISKEAIQLAGFDFPGHTEFLAKQTAVKDFLMMLVSGDLRVALLTIHEPIARVAGLITQERILSSLNTLSDALRSDFGVEKPRIAVLGLNPHAGDGGVIGTEEIEIIKPALEAAQATGLDVAGPFPADGFFGRRGDKEFDALLAMYHDQGLAPFKALAMGAGVNVTLGLPIVRTSPDHGTAFGIAGEGVASADSMKEAILRASDIVQKRQAASS